MIKDIQTAIAFTNLSPARRDRLSALLSGANRAWKVVERAESAGQSVYTGCRDGYHVRPWQKAHLASGHAVDTQKASARLLRIGRR